MWAMALRVSELTILAESLCRFNGQRVGKFIQYSRDVFSFHLARAGRLMVVLDNQNPCVYISRGEEPGPSLPTTAATLLRKRLGGAQLNGVSVLNNDRVLRIEFLATNDIFQTVPLALVLELIPTKANMALLDENGKILYCFRPSGLTEPRPLCHGLTYEPPLKKGDFEPEETTFDFDAYCKACEAQELKRAERRKADVYQDFYRRLKARIKSLEHKSKQIEADIRNGQAHAGDAVYGDYIFTYLEEIKPGDKVLEVDDLKIPLDPLKSPSENAADYYKKARKAKNAIALGEENLRHAKKELLEARHLLDFANNADEETLSRLVKEEKKPGKNPVKGQRISHKGPLPFIAKSGDLHCFFGKSAKQNDYLSFLYATKSDYLFVHVKDQTGSHVILPYANPSDEALLFACEIALLSSNKLDGEVQYTAHKNIRKGSHPGQVILGSYQSTYIKNIRPETTRAYEAAIAEDET